MEILKRKLVIVGDGNCGKTCLLIVFSKDVFPEDYIPTVFDTYVTDVQVDGKHVLLSLWDTAGQEDFDRLRPISYPDTDVVLICFSVDSPDSLDNVLDSWYPEIRHFCPYVPTILVGTKKDLRFDTDAIEELARSNKKPVNSERGREMAKTINAKAYLECSAKTKDGVAEVFQTAVRATMDSQHRKRKVQCVLI